MLHQKQKTLKRSAKEPHIVDLLLAAPPAPDLKLHRSEQKTHKPMKFSELFGPLAGLNLKRSKETIPPPPRLGQPWQLQEAKAKFSELFDKAITEGPQVVTRRNKEAVVIIPEAEFRKLTQGPENPPCMLRALLKCPKGPALKIHRNKKDNVLNLPRVFE